MAKPSFDEFTDMLDQAVNQIPPHFCRALTGGFNVQEDEKRQGENYVLGEYVKAGYLGCFIVFYYGSFVRVMRAKTLAAWEAEIMDTVLHEMQHHLEAQAGTNDLALKEMEELAKALRTDKG